MGRGGLDKVAGDEAPHLGCLRAGAVVREDPRPVGAPPGVPIVGLDGELPPYSHGNPIGGFDGVVGERRPNPHELVGVPERRRRLADGAVAEGVLQVLYEAAMLAEGVLIALFRPVQRHDARCFNEEVAASRADQLRLAKGRTDRECAAGIPLLARLAQLDNFEEPAVLGEAQRPSDSLGREAGLRSQPVRGAVLDQPVQHASPPPTARRTLSLP